MWLRNHLIFALYAGVGFALFAGCASLEDSTSDASSANAEYLDPASTSFVFGTVLDTRRKPMADVLVTLALQGEDGEWGELKADALGTSRTYRTMTDAEGGYMFGHIPHTGGARVNFYKEGYAGGCNQVTLQPGQPQTTVDIELESGKTIRGRLRQPDGRPVNDAVVSVLHAWHEKDYAWGWGYAVTDKRGRFELGLNPAAKWFSLRVNSDSLGQRFFLKLPVDEDTVTLTMEPTGALRGVITHRNGAPAEAVEVHTSSVLEQPKLLHKFYTGLSPSIVFRAKVNTEGAYGIAGLPPNLEYAVTVAQPIEGKGRLRYLPVSPSPAERFVAVPGEVRRWDYVVNDPIVIQGQVTTESTGRPVGDVSVVVETGGGFVVSQTMTSTDGRYELQLGTGPGDYFVYAAPLGCSSSSEKELKARFGQRFAAQDSGEREMNLHVCEPTSLPVRVLDYRGNPVESIQAEIHVTGLDGERAGYGTSYRLDRDGRVCFVVYQPVSDMCVSINKFGPGFNQYVRETKHYSAKPGDVLAEETITLPPFCGVSGMALHPDGSPVAGRDMHLISSAADGTTVRASCKTDAAGHFSVEDGVLARTAELTLTYEGVAKSFRCKLPGVEYVPDEVNDLGTLTFQVMNTSDN